MNIDLKNFLYDLLDSVFPYILFLVALIVLLDYFDDKSVERHENFINSHREDLTIYNDCFEYDNKYYCYVEE